MCLFVHNWNVVWWILWHTLNCHGQIQINVASRIHYIYGCITYNSSIQPAPLYVEHSSRKPTIFLHLWIVLCIRVMVIQNWWLYLVMLCFVLLLVKFDMGMALDFNCKQSYLKKFACKDIHHLYGIAFSAATQTNMQWTKTTWYCLLNSDECSETRIWRYRRT